VAAASIGLGGAMPGLESPTSRPLTRSFKTAVPELRLGVLASREASKAHREVLRELGAEVAESAPSR